VSVLATASAWLTGLAQDLNPDGSEARQWLADELANDEYRDGRPLLTRIIEWLVDVITDLLSGFRVTGVSGGGAPPIVVALVVVVLLAGLALLLSRLRRERRTVTSSDAVLGDLNLSVVEFRDRGRASIREGRWNDAVIDFTRAIAREAADRTLLSDAPSLTAHEIGAQLAPVFPEHAEATARTMDLFDSVRYGRYAATEADARATQAHDETLRKARPVLAGHSTLPVADDSSVTRPS